MKKNKLKARKNKIKVIDEITPLSYGMVNGNLEMIYHVDKSHYEYITKEVKQIEEK